jgi:hypothetical protein
VASVQPRPHEPVGSLGAVAFAGPKVRVEEPEPSFELATPALEFGFDRGWSAPVVTGAEGITNLIRLA